MEICQIAESAVQGLGFSNFNDNRHKFSSSRVLQVSAVLNPVDIVVSPSAKSNIKTAPRKRIRKARRTKRMSLQGGGADYGEEGRFFGEDGFGDGPFGGGGGGGGGGNGGGGGWSFRRDDGWNWDDSASPSWSDPAFDLLYEIMSWAALSNCVYFSFKRLMRINDNEREKVAVTFTPIC